MFRERKNRMLPARIDDLEVGMKTDNQLSWCPTASLAALKKRAAIYSQIRQFFAERSVLEVETPLMSYATVTDPHIISIPATFKTIGSSKEQIVYLQTSPEYAMKRLLAAGSGSIYQITKAFRQGEIGRLHNPEFTMLEWYRLGFDHHQLMDEMDALLSLILQTPAAERMTYGNAFEQYVGVNPHLATIDELQSIVKKHAIPFDHTMEKNGWLDLLFTHCIEPHLGKDRPFFMYDFPASQAALAKIRLENPPVASRFEVYFKGVELANGFHELQDATEQRRRFEANQIYRNEYHLPSIPLDENFLSALEHGLPECAGVALGLDRLILLTLNAEKIADVLSFAFNTIRN
jgi:lysyl-tRNA synthetase class 2